ncbi:hypothetical protein IEQ34_001103 [Dendrobium chrysotoxum]|uniref:Uncharacterized protein n=1 Tax=Dendrobium chrysotoxum TaxID=161865 RepID=A0AAV7H5Y7_DENCH|nr:hypothetical protein IEQ34_001103 [Dendrobium chrysotoxum]
MKSDIKYFKECITILYTVCTRLIHKRIITKYYTHICGGVYKYEKEAYEMYWRYAHNASFSVHKEYHSYWPNSRKT